MCQSTTIHAFEKAGLGVAPFKLVGVETTADRQMMNRERESNGQLFTTNMCGGTCDYCGTAIWEVYKIRSADGKEFKVGCDCVMKTGDAGLINLAKKQHNAIVTKQRHERERNKIDEIKKLIADNRETLASMPHPRGWEGKTALEYVEWMFANSGNSGKIRCGKVIAEMLKK